ncbi:MAG TPA: dihydrolipoamide acetyltransferase family protein, partial [Gemmatimonadaceae bacterium]|nr:dihydrolipoamide acetyltransferase family protein [Gemmatimonadaceae bacterium]
MARVDIIMPQMGESIAEGTLSKWLKKVGDEVKRDEPIFEISTDKVDAEIPAPAAGVLAEILVKEGETVAVQTIVARLETEKGAVVGKGEPAPADSRAAAQSTPAPQPQEKPAPAAPHREPSAAPVPPRQQPPTPAIAASHSGNGNSFEDRVRTKSSPLVRKIAAEHGVNIASLHGSGVAGRVTKRDILGFIESGARTPSGAPGMRTGVPFGGHALPLPEPWAGDVVEPMTKMRALISDHMVASRHTSAHVTSFIEVDFTRVARIRAKNKAEFEVATGQKLSYMPFIIKAVTQGLQAFPVMNSSVAGTNIIYRKQINIGVAVALDWGLIVPVIKQADDLSLSGITRALNDLAARARAKKLSPEEV